MAGDWIKIRHSLATDPDVIAVAIRLGIDEDTLVGKLHRLWSWFDIHTEDGRADRVTTGWLDVSVKCPGFCAALSEIGWLCEENGAVVMPNFDHHNGDSAKARATDAVRKRKQRSGVKSSKKSPKSVRNKKDKSVTRGEERREEESIDPPNGGSYTAEAIRDELIASWKTIEGLPQIRDFTGKRMASLRARLREPPWRDSWRQAIARIPSCKFLLGEGGDGWKADIDFFLQPDSVTRILEGKYDHAKRPSGGNRNEPSAGQRYDPNAKPDGVF